MKKYINKFTLLFSVLFVLTGCEQDLNENLISTTNDINFVGIEAKPLIQIGKDATETVDLVVATTKPVGSDTTFNIDVDASGLTIANTIPSSVTIPANTNTGVLSITLTDDNSLGFDSQNLILSLVPADGFVSSASKTLNIEVSERCDDTIVDLEITTDNWPDETTWELYDLNGASPVLIASGGPYNNPDDDFTTILTQFCLQSGTYGIALYDSYGDGISGGGYEILVDGEVISSGTPPGGNPPNQFTVVSNQFTIP